MELPSRRYSDSDVREHYSGNRGDQGIIARMRGLLVAFLIFFLLTFTIVGWIGGMLLMAESFDDTREAGVDAWNSDVRDWNAHSRTSFESLGSSLRVDGHSLEQKQTDAVWEELARNDNDPSELEKPDPLFLSLKQDISTIAKKVNDDPKPGAATLEITVSAGDVQRQVFVPLVFQEVKCHYQQRGKIAREVCKDHWYVLQGVCIKVDRKGSPTRSIDAISGASRDFGCFMGTEGMFEPRTTHIWSPGRYSESSSLAEVKVPDLIEIDIRSNTDPALTAGIYTGGYYSFGQSPGAKFATGLVFFILSSCSLSIFFGMCVLQYTWPTANSYTDRMRYFYRRHLRKYTLCKWLVDVTQPAAAQASAAGPGASTEGLIGEGSEWDGRGSGKRLGGDAETPLVTVQAREAQPR